MVTESTGETHTDDNTCIDGTVRVTRAGDFGSLPEGWGAFDDSCDSDDFFLFRDSYVSYYHLPADFNNDSQVNSDDFFDFRNCYIGTG